MNPRCQRGFTLFEVLAAVTLLGVVVSLLLTALAQGLATQADAGETSKAVWLCQKTLQEVVLGLETRTAGRYDAPWDHFSWRVDIQRLSSPPVRRIKVTVTWAGATAAKEVSLCGIAE